jgi:hypothetical protein
MQLTVSVPTLSGYIYGDEADDSDENLTRQFVLCEEDCRGIACIDPRLVRGNPIDVRWYRSANIIDLVRIRRVRAKRLMT